MSEQRGDRFAEVEERYSGYEVYDRDGDKIGKVDDLFVDENDQPEYIGVKMGLFGLSGATLIPWEMVRAQEESQRLEVLADKATVKEGPSFDDDEEITPDYEQRVYEHYGLQRTDGAAERGGYGSYYRDEDHAASSAGERAGAAGPGMTMGDREAGGEFRPHPPDEEGVKEREDDLADEDELRVQRTEEELRAGAREREAGAMNVRKRVRTDREQVRVPKRREEVNVERVPVNEERTGAEIGEDEVMVPVTEEEVVVDKKPVVKEELRIRKDVVQDEEVVEEDVRKEEVDIEDATERGLAGRETDIDEETRRRSGR